MTIQAPSAPSSQLGIEAYKLYVKTYESYLSAVLKLAQKTSGGRSVPNKEPRTVADDAGEAAPKAPVITPLKDTVTHSRKSSKRARNRKARSERKRLSQAQPERAKTQDDGNPGVAEGATPQALKAAAEPKPRPQSPTPRTTGVRFADAARDPTPMRALGLTRTVSTLVASSSVPFPDRVVPIFGTTDRLEDVEVSPATTAGSLGGSAVGVESEWETPTTLRQCDCKCIWVASDSYGCPGCAVRWVKNGALTSAGNIGQRGRKRQGILEDLGPSRFRGCRFHSMGERSPSPTPSDSTHSSVSTDAGIRAAREMFAGDTSSNYVVDVGGSKS